MVSGTAWTHRWTIEIHEDEDGRIAASVWRVVGTYPGGVTAEMETEVSKATVAEALDYAGSWIATDAALAGRA